MLIIIPERFLEASLPRLCPRLTKSGSLGAYSASGYFFKSLHDSNVFQGLRWLFTGRLFSCFRKGNRSPQSPIRGISSFTPFLQVAGSLLCCSCPQFSPGELLLILQNPAQDCPIYTDVPGTSGGIRSSCLPELPLPHPSRSLALSLCSPVAPTTRGPLEPGCGMVINMFPAPEPKSRGEPGNSLLPSHPHAWPGYKNIFGSLPSLRPLPLVHQSTSVSPDWTLIFIFLALRGHHAQI